MATEKLRSLLREKSLKEQFSFNPQKVNLIYNLYSNLEGFDNLPEQIQLTTSKEKGLVVDDRVVEDEIGLSLYEFAWKGVLPAYVKSKDFVEKAQDVWEKLGKDGLGEFKRKWVIVGDQDTLQFLVNASEKELFEFWFRMDFVYEEKMIALNSLFKIASRAMKKEEYFDWANKFKIALSDSI